MENNEIQEVKQQKSKIEKVSIDEIKTSKENEIVDSIMSKILKIK